MKYFEVAFSITPYSRDVADVLCALLADEGFEAFDASDNGLVAWVQQQQYSAEGVARAIDALPFPGIAVHYRVAEAPDENWNKRWEEDGYKPIVVYDDATGHCATPHALVAIHDTMHPDVPEAQFDICISPCQAFGTGSHETTRMILRQLHAMPMHGRSVIDAGTGTGILAIFCHMLGAKDVLAYDIDEWSVRNALDNLTLNGITDGVRVLLGDSTVLTRPGQDQGQDKSLPCQQSVSLQASLLIANINRNILMNDMPLFAESVGQDGELLLSGFYVTDVPMLVAEARRLGFSLYSQSEDREWAMILLKKEKHTVQ